MICARLWWPESVTSYSPRGRGMNRRSAAIFIASLIITDSLTGGSSSAQTPCPSQWICYNAATIPRDEVISTIKTIFKSHGYEVSETPGTTLQFQTGGVRQISSETTRFVYINWQMPTKATKGQKWRYQASLVPPKDNAVMLQVMVQTAPRQLLGVTVNEAASEWQPPDMTRIRDEIRNRLQDR